MLDSVLIEKSRDFALDYANGFLKKLDKDFIKIHSISIMGGAARCYFNTADMIENHKDFDMDIYFCHKNGHYIEQSVVSRINTQGTPKVFKNTGFLPTIEDHLDIARIVIWNSQGSDFIYDVRKHAELHNNSSRWIGSKGRPGRIGNPMLFVYPEIMAVEHL